MRAVGHLWNRQCLYRTWIIINFFLLRKDNRRITNTYTFWFLCIFTSATWTDDSI